MTLSECIGAMMEHLDVDFRNRLEEATKKAQDNYVPILMALSDDTVSMADAFQMATSIVTDYVNELAIDMTLCAAADVVVYLGDTMSLKYLNGHGPKPWFFSQLESQFRPHGMTGDLRMKLVSLSLIGLIHSPAKSEKLWLGAQKLDQYIESHWPIGDDYVEY